MERFDCHCHIFNIINVGVKAILEQLQETEPLLTRSDGTAVSLQKISAKKKQNLGDKIKKIAELIRIFKDDSEKIFDLLDKHYDRKYKLFPLMFDGDYLLDTENREPLAYMNQLVSEASMENIQEKQSPKRLSVGKKFRSIGAEDSEVVLNFLKELSDRMDQREKANAYKSGFDVQYEQIKKMSANPKYKDRLVPFLGVDPRRANIRSYLDQVGKGKLFAGVKVYPPNGFSPCDKVLVGEGSVFEYCNKFQIPVVSHCSYGGFATPAMNIAVNGMIIPDGKELPEPFEGTYTFQKKLRDGFTVMVRERASVLNNPLIWEEVMKKYPGLILVLAHFGSGSDEWQGNILRILKTYPNLYTDVSCMSDEDTLTSVKDIYQNNPGIRHKILYGSDYFLDMFFNDSFQAYLERMQKIFGQEMFDTLSSVNPVNYMKKWYQQ